MLLPFFGMGIFVIVQALAMLRRGGHAGEGAALLAFGALFCGFPAFGAWALLYGMRKAAESAAVRAHHADEPWLWHPDWASGVCRDTRMRGSVALWPLAIFWNVISLPLPFLISREVAKNNLAVLVVVIFPVIGIALLISAAYQSLRHAKFGDSQLRLDAIPLRPGATFRGQLEMRMREMPREGFRYELTSLRRVTRGSGKSRSTQEYPIWSETAVLPSTSFAFTIPADADQTDERNPVDQLVWRLAVTAAVPGIDYAATFELPVFRPAGSPDFVMAAAPELPPDAPVTIGATADGAQELVVGPRREPGAAAGSFAFLALWVGAIGWMLTHGAPFAVLFFFAFIAILLTITIVDAFFGRTIIRADRSGVTVNRVWMGRGKPRTFATNAVETIAPCPASTASWDVEVRLRGSAERIATGARLRSRGEAQALAAKVLAAMGRGSLSS